MDLLTQVKEEVESFGYDVSLKRFDTFTGKEGVYLSPVQASLITAYMDGSEERLQPYQIVVRMREAKAASQTCSDIATRLERADFPSKDGSYQWVSGGVYEHPQELELEEAGFYAWVCQMQARVIVY